MTSTSGSSNCMLLSVDKRDLKASFAFYVVIYSDSDSLTCPRFTASLGNTA